MKFGIIYVAWQTENYIAPSLESWVKARISKLDGDEYIICAISVPFSGFSNNDPLDSTISQLQDYVRAKEIDHLITEPTDVKETEARGAALKWLMDKNIDYSIMVDSDEIWKLNEIQKTVSFIKSNPFIVWYRLCLKNFVFDTKTYLIDPFTPPRIHKICAKPFYASHFYNDNDICYETQVSKAFYPQDSMSHITIPKELVWVSHFSWLSDERSRKKIEYQLNGRGWPLCSFKWNYKTNTLKFNEEYYEKMGQPFPEVASLSTPK